MIAVEVMEVTQVMEVMEARNAGQVGHAGLWRRAFLSCITFITYITSITFIFITCTSPASAAERPFAAPQVAEHVPASTAGGLLQVTFSLLLVLAAVFAAAWVVRRLRGFGNASSRAIQIIADAPLGTKERAVLLQVGGQQLLVGVAPGQVSLLHVLTERVGDGLRATGDGLSPDASSLAQVPGPMPHALDFKAILKRSLGL